MGAKQFNFELWGDAVDVASYIHTTATPNAILITQQVFERLDTDYSFQPATTITYHGEKIALYELGLEAVSNGAITAETEQTLPGLNAPQSSANHVATELDEPAMGTLAKEIG